MSEYPMVEWRRRPVNGGEDGGQCLTVGYVGDPDADRCVLVISLLHGDEDPGVLIIRSILDRLGVSWRPAGLVKLVPVANPDAAIAQSRMSPIDRLDANRLALGDPRGHITECLVSAVCAEAEGASLVIVLHSFETATRITGIFTNPSDPDVRVAALRALRTLHPDFVITIPFSPLVASLDGALGTIGIPCVSIELPRADQLRMTDVNRVTGGVLRTMAEHGAVYLDDLAEVPSRDLPACYRRIAVRAGRLAVWAPQRRLGDCVRADEILGTLDYLPTFHRMRVTAADLDDREPVLHVIQIRPLEVVRPNDILVGLGLLDPSLVAEFELLSDGSVLRTSPASR